MSKRAKVDLLPTWLMQTHFLSNTVSSTIASTHQASSSITWSLTWLPPGSVNCDMSHPVSKVDYTWEINKLRSQLKKSYFSPAGGGRANSPRDPRWGVMTESLIKHEELINKQCSAVLTNNVESISWGPEVNHINMSSQTSSQWRGSACVPCTRAEENPDLPRVGVQTALFYYFCCDNYKYINIISQCHTALCF